MFKNKTEFDCVHLAAKLPKSDILQLLLSEKKSYVNVVDNDVE